MSGGVDSAVAAVRLLAQGYDVQGVSLRMWEGNRGARVCSDYSGAAELAKQLGISHSLLDFRGQFRDTVVRSFAGEYLRGRTPNPCIACNRDFKLGTLLTWARQRGADYVATGHYARIARERGGLAVSLLRGIDRGKDQSYFLFGLSREQLDHTLFPLGGMHKAEVRAEARRLKLAVAERPESQDICFGDYKSLVNAYANESAIAGGEVVDRGGKILGRHRGIHRVTVGQRRGLGISAAEPLYVIDIDPETRRVVVGNKKALACEGLMARSVHWLSSPDNGEIDAEVQVRYRAPAVPCIIRIGDGQSCEVRFRRPVAAVTPGQAAVFYRGEKLLGGGWIDRALAAVTSEDTEPAESDRPRNRP